MKEKSLRSVDDLVAAGLLPADGAAELRAVADRFAVEVSPAMVAIIRTAGPDSPVGQQFIPVPGIVHRYPDRVLFKLVSVCPVYCRFCFRREMVGPQGDGAMSDEDISAAIAYIETRPEIREVILTGGDPLMLSARRIEALMARLNGLVGSSMAPSQWISGSASAPARSR